MNKPKKIYLIKCRDSTFKDGSVIESFYNKEEAEDRASKLNEEDVWFSYYFVKEMEIK